MKLNATQALAVVSPAVSAQTELVVPEIDAEPAEDEHDQEQRDRRHRGDHLPPTESVCVHFSLLRSRRPVGPPLQYAGSLYGGSGGRSRSRRRSTVFASSIAIVIGPTPPGTGVICPGDLGDGVVVDVADQPASRAVHPDVDHGRAGLDPIRP